MVILIKDAFDESLPLKLASFGEVTSDESRLKEADVLLIRSKTKCTREFLSGLDKLKVIIRGGVGMDNIDKEACKENRKELREDQAAFEDYAYNLQEEMFGEAKGETTE